MKKHLTILIITLAVVSTALADMEFRSSSDIQVYSPFEMNSNKITGVADPEDSFDAVNRNWTLGRFVARDGDTMTGNLDMDGNRIQNVPTDPDAGTDAVNKNYVQNQIATTSGVQDLSEVLEEGSTANQSIDMGSNDITNLQDPDASFDAVSRNWTVGRFVSSEGDSINGLIDMRGHDIRNLKDPDSAQDAATKSYVDGELGNATGNLSQVLEEGSTANQSINMDGNDINMSGGNITTGSNEMCLGDSC